MESRQKSKIMWVIIIILMICVVLGWVFLIPYSVDNKNNGQQGLFSAIGQAIEDGKPVYNNIMSSIKDGINNIKNVQENDAEIEQEKINNLKEQMISEQDSENNN